ECVNTGPDGESGASMPAVICPSDCLIGPLPLTPIPSRLFSMTDLSSIPAITPATIGFRMPAEWESHAATWLAWPHNLDTWPGKFAPIPGVYVAMVKALHMHEQVNICVNDAEAAGHVRHLLTQAGVNLGNVTLYEIPTNDTWARDYGPIFLTHTSARQ